MVFQRPAMLRRSAGGNIRLCAGGRRRAARATRGTRSANSARSSASTGSAIVRRGRLSGGEQQRLALARALAKEPQVLLLDEPTASLDPAATKAIEDVIRAVAARGIKVVMSTHDLGEAKRLAGEIVLMHRGRVIESGPADAFFAAPQTRGGPPIHRRRACSFDRLHSRATRNEKENMMPTRRSLFVLAADHRRARRRAGACAGQVDRRRLHHVDAGLRPVRPYPAAVQGQDRHRREGGGAGHRPGARHRPARRCRRGVRARQAAGGEIRRRRRRRETLPGDVQRLHPGRPEERSRRHQGHERRRRGVEGHQGQGRTLHLPRRPIGHACRRA